MKQLSREEALHILLGDLPYQAQHGGGQLRLTFGTCTVEAELSQEDGGWVLTAAGETLSATAQNFGHAPRLNGGHPALDGLRPGSLAARYDPETAKLILAGRALYTRPALASHHRQSVCVHACLGGVHGSFWTDPWDLPAEYAWTLLCALAQEDGTRAPTRFTAYA